MTSNFSIEFGALAEPISEQLLEQGVALKENDAKRFDRAADSIVFLHLQGLIPDSVRDSTRQKLIKQISVAVHEND